MSVQSPIRNECETLDAIVARLGDIPLSRIWTCPPPGTATEADVLHADDRLDRLCELVDGVLVEKPMGYIESKLAALIIIELGSYLNIQDLGDVAGADGMLKLAPGLVRIPDVSVVLWDLLPDGVMPEGRIPAVAPHIAIEVLSDSNTDAEMQRKVREYFEAGSRLVILIDPMTRATRRYTSLEDFTTVAEDVSLSFEPLLPGFSLTLKPLFDKAARRSKKS